jgi:hypothetical protein
MEVTALWDIVPRSLAEVDRIPESCHPHIRCRENLRSHTVYQIRFHSSAYTQQVLGDLNFKVSVFTLKRLKCSVERHGGAPTLFKIQSASVLQEDAADCNSPSWLKFCGMAVDPPLTSWPKYYVSAVSTLNCFFVIHTFIFQFLRFVF